MHHPSRSAHVSVCVPQRVCEGPSCVCESCEGVYESVCVCCGACVCTEWDTLPANLILTKGRGSEAPCVAGRCNQEPALLPP